MLKDNCGCGQCNFKELITNGCPKPLRPQFLYLDSDTLTQNEKHILLLKLKEDANSIDEAYFTVVHQFDDWMKCNVPVKKYRKILSSIRGAMRNNGPLLTDRWSEIRTANHSDLSVLLSKYHSWFNCSVLNQVLQRAKIVTKKDPTEVLSSLESYTKRMHEYSKRNIFECSPPSDMSSTKRTCTYCIFKMKDHLLPDKKHEFTVDEIELLTANVMKMFKLEEYSLKLCTFTEGCVELVYSIPLCIYPELFPLNEDQCRYLTTLGVSEITTKDYHYKLEHVSNILHGCACIRSPFTPNSK